jgi:hypothetical protein
MEDADREDPPEAPDDPDRVDRERGVQLGQLHGSIIVAGVRDFKDYYAAPRIRPGFAGFAMERSGGARPP